MYYFSCVFTNFIIIIWFKCQVNELVQLGKKKKKKYLGIILSVIGVMTGIVALIIDDRDFDYNKEKDRKNIKPYLYIKLEKNLYDDIENTYHYKMSNENDIYNILIRNDGGGLTEIEKINYHYNKKKYSKITDILIEENVATQENYFSIDEVFKEICIRKNLDTNEPHVLLKGTCASLFEIEVLYNFDSVKFLSILKDLVINVIYMDKDGYEYTKPLEIQIDYS